MAALEVIKNLSISTIGMADIMTSGYSESYKKLKGLRPAAPNVKKAISELFEALEEDVKNYYHGKNESLERKRRTQKLMHRLRKDKLIIENKQNGNGILGLTKKGEGKRALLELRYNKLPRYKSEKSDQTIIVAFDIPERERWKRAWVRAALKTLGLYFVQRSLWAGKVKLPPEFIHDLEKLNLVRCVEIFAVTGSGSLRKIEL